MNPTLLGEIGQGRYTLSNGINTYNALQSVIQERFTNGLQAQLNYTWAKCLSDTPGFHGQFGDNVPTEAQTMVRLHPFSKTTLRVADSPGTCVAPSEKLGS